MRTIILIVAGLVLLAVFCFIARLFKGDHGVSRTATIFIGLWFIVAAVNLSMGVISAGYTVLEKMPFFLAVFGVPALVALVIRRRFNY